MNFFIKDFFTKCDQIRSFLRIWSHLLRKSLLENFIFCAVSLATDGKVSFIDAITLSQAASFTWSMSIFPLHSSFCFLVNRLYKLFEQRLWQNQLLAP